MGSNQWKLKIEKKVDVVRVYNLTTIITKPGENQIQTWTVEVVPL